MPEYRRCFLPGGTYFFTVVTYSRKPIFTYPEARDLLHSVWEFVREKHPFTTGAICLLPDHIHCIWTLTPGDADYSTRWKEIKRIFTHKYLDQIGKGGYRNASRQKREEAAIWQRRFWEHTLRDEQDFHRHMDYIHYNPVKHGLVQRVRDWPWSSFHRYVRQEYYDLDWGEGIEAIEQNLGEENP
ncbi:MAG: transposase [Chloroflexi bacterium]|nr:transposase [Chloroflexota bacterium]